MAIGKRRDSRADVPTCGLTCRDSGLGGPHPPSAQNLPLCGDTSPTSTWTIGPARWLEDGVASSGSVMTPAGRLLIRKCVSTCDKKPRWTQVQKGRRFSGRRPRRRLVRRPSRTQHRLSGNTSRERAPAGTRDAIPILDTHEERTGMPASAARVLRVLGDPIFERRARHPD